MEKEKFLNMEVIEGKDGFLFLSQSAHHVIEYILGEKKPDIESINNFEQNIKFRKNFCEKRNIKYFHVIFPDKHTVMKTHFPIKNFNSLINYYEPIINRYNFILDLRNIINHEHLNNNFCYCKTDTHLNFYGKKITTKYILKIINPELDEVEIEKNLNLCKGEEIEIVGDLGNKLLPNRSEKDYKIKTPWLLRRFNNRQGANEGLVIICFNRNLLRNKKNKRLLIFGDSFLELSIELLSYSFSEILFLRSRYFHTEIVEMYKPDIIISENIERYLDKVVKDENAPRFNLIYGLRGIPYPDKKDFYEAYNAVLNFNKPIYNSFITKII
jgi:hypothetical protein